MVRNEWLSRSVADASEGLMEAWTRWRASPAAHEATLRTVLTEIATHLYEYRKFAQEEDVEEMVEFGMSRAHMFDPAKARISSFFTTVMLGMLAQLIGARRRSKAHYQ